MIYIIWNTEHEAYRAEQGFTCTPGDAQLYLHVEDAVAAAQPDELAVLIEPPYPIDWLAERLTETAAT